MFKHIWSRLTLGTLLVISVISCVKEENKIGDDLVGGVNTITQFIDTVEISTKIKIVDSVKSANLNYSIIGAINDPKFGKTNASLYSQLFLEQNNIDFGGTQFDSIILILPYQDYYGDTTSNQQFKIYEVSETIDTFKTYSNSTYETSDVIGDYTFTPHPVESTSGSTETFGDLRIPILPAFGNKIFSKSGLAELENDDNFKEYIKGFAIIPENNHAQEEGALFTFDYQKIKFRLFYTSPVTGQDSINFVCTNSSQRLNSYDHLNYQGSEASLSFNQLNTENLYIQGLAGLEIEVDFPNIGNLQETLGGESVVINKAVLQAHRTTDTLVNYTASVALLANEYRKPNDGSTDEFNYYQILDGNKLGGLYDSDENLYNFTITRYLNQRIKGLSSEKLYLRSFTYRALDRVVLSGVSGSDDTKKMKLNIVYTVNE